MAVNKKGLNFGGTDKHLRFFIDDYDGKMKAIDSDNKEYSLDDLRKIPLAVDKCLKNCNILIKKGESMVMFGPQDMSKIKIEIGGELCIITGAKDKILRFDDKGFPTTSKASIKDDGRLNLPVLYTHPTDLQNGDVYIYNSGSNTQLVTYINGVSKTINFS